MYRFDSGSKFCLRKDNISCDLPESNDMGKFVYGTIIVTIQQQ